MCILGKLEILMCLTQVTNDGVEALIAQEAQPVGMKSLPAHYRRAQANMGKVREKIEKERGDGS